MFYLVKTPPFITSWLKNYTWKKPAGNKKLYLTFDDGPHPEATPFVLDTLKQFNAKATFFCIGKNVVAHPEIYRRILDEGHAVGNHTYHHKNGWKVKDEEYLEDVQLAAEVIHSKWFRPPYGRITPFQAAQLRRRGFEIVLWTVLSGDFDPKLTAEKCLENVLLNSGDGSVIVFHDSQKSFNHIQTVLPAVLKHFKNDGFNFASLND